MDIIYCQKEPYILRDSEPPRIPHRLEYFTFFVHHSYLFLEMLCVWNVYLSHVETQRLHYKNVPGADYV